MNKNHPSRPDIFRAGALSIALACLAGPAIADVPHAFEAGEPASAADVNENFSALADAVGELTSELESLASDNEALADEVETLQTAISELEAENETLSTALAEAESEIAGLAADQSDLSAAVSSNATEIAGLWSETEALESSQSTLGDEVAVLSDDSIEQGDRITDIEDSELFARENFVVDLDEFLEVHFTSPMDTAIEGPILRLTGANLQIINQAEDQTTPDGTGNLVVGFATARSVGSAGADRICSDGQYSNQADCEAAGETWSNDHKSGSHNIVGGVRPAFSQTGGLIVGENNAITGIEASVTGGRNNLASGLRSTVSGGGSAGTTHGNIASGIISTVSGGVGNQSRSIGSTVSGGRENVVTTTQGTVSGGRDCTVSGSQRWGAIDSQDNTFGDC